MLFPGGYVTFTNDDINQPEYHFYLTDHQGNIRVVANQNGEVEQVNHYYPYGGLMGESTNSDHQPYKYNGKELDRHHGLDWFDYGARWYNGYSWMTPDPLAEKYREVSPYMYCMGNPIKYVDPDGRKIVGVTKKDALNFRDDIFRVLSDQKFAGVRDLISVKGKRFQKVDTKTLNSVLYGVSLSIDEKTYIDMVVNTINSDDIHKIEYVSIDDNVSLKGGQSINNHFKNKQLPSLLTSDGVLKAETLSYLGGEGFNVPTKQGSHSVIISGVPGNDVDRSVTSGHEVFGHGIPSAKKENDIINNINAIRTDNLIRRLLGLPQRDGHDHAGGSNGGIIEPYLLPLTK